MDIFLFDFSPLCVVLWIIILVVLLLYLFGRFYFFEKIGVAGWRGLIPVYSSYLYFKKANENPIFPVILIFSYLFLNIYNDFFLGIEEIRNIFLFFKSIIIIIGLIVFWNANFYVSNKMKSSYILSFFLTFFPVFTIPFIGLSNKFRWSRLSKINNNFLLNDFYSSRKITISDVLISNFVTVISTIIVIYVTFFVFTSLLSVDKIVEIMWNPYFILIIVLIIFILVCFVTVIDYFINKYKLTKRK